MEEDIIVDEDDAKILAFISTTSLIKELISRHAHKGHAAIIQTIAPEEGQGLDTINSKFGLYCNDEDDFNRLFGCLVQSLEDRGIYINDDEEDDES